MPLFLVERTFAEQMQLDASEAKALMAVNADVSVVSAMAASAGRFFR